MVVRFTRDRLFLYAAITVGYLVHWIYDDIKAYPGGFAVSLVNNIWQVVFIVGLNLLYFEYVLPFVTSIKTNRAVAVVFSIVVHLIVFAIGLYAWRLAGEMLTIYDPFRNYSGIDKFYASARYAPGPFLVFAVCKLFFDYTQLRYEGQQAKLEKKQAELQFLRSQINPHFLFNTLNNIYSLSQHQPQLVSESVLRLSKILRYLLYEASSEFITIDKEIRILSDYVDLERLRYTDSVTIDVGFEIDNYGETMPPLLLIPLLENAFKHGVSVTRGTRFVEAKCILRKRQLQFVVRNSSSASPDYEEAKENIGLSNMRRRLELLYRRFELVTERNEGVFTATLRIDLSSHV
jgi:two-component system LytT family sensor kinase